MIVGILAAIMGVAAGSSPSHVRVHLRRVHGDHGRTDILQIIFTAGLASIAQYAIYGYVFYTLAMGMLIGSLIGIQVGAPHDQGRERHPHSRVLCGLDPRGFHQQSGNTPQKDGGA